MPVIKNIKIRKHDVARRPAFTLQEYMIFVRKLRSWIVTVTTPEKDRWRWKTELYDKRMLYYYVLFLVNTGIRTGSETIGLEWRDIEYEDGHVFINVLNGKRGGGTCIAMPIVKKSLESWREISNHTKPEDKVFGELHDQKGVSEKFKKLLTRMLTDLDLLFGREGTKRTFYSFRHTYISFRLQYGNVDILNLAKNCRTSVAKIESNYGHIIMRDVARNLTSRKKARPKRKNGNISNLKNG
jgi:integrase